MKDVRYFGILNVTPDSFSDGGQFLDPGEALEQADKLIKDGAHFIDVGGESTRPGAEVITAEEEWGRVGGILETLVEKYPRQVSLDTRHTENAEKFFRLGGMFLNSVTGFSDPVMCELAAQFCVMCVVNHFPGKTAEEVHEQEISSINQVRDELLMRKAFMIRSGILPERIILDPGIGFGKTMGLNHQLLCFAEMIEDPVLIGHSRKRFLGEDRFQSRPNREAAELAIKAGAKYLRVHDPEIYQGLTG